MAPARTRLARRRFLQGSVALAGLGLLSGCGVSMPWAQPGPRTYRIGWLAIGTPTSMAELLDALRQGLRDLGYLEGQNLLIETRWAENQQSRLPELAAELVQLNPDLIVCQSGPSALAAKRLTATIPIVAVSVPDPVELGLAESLAHPGGNVTGLTLAPAGVGAKRIQLLKETAPGISRVAVFWNPDNPTDVRDLAVMQGAAPTLNLTLLPFEVRDPAGFAPAFAAAIAQGADSASFYAVAISPCCSPQIVDFIVQHRLPTVHNNRNAWRDAGGLNAGGLMFYGLNGTDNYRRAAYYVDKILKGANPAELPIEQPTTFEFVINLKTAQALDLTIPPSVLQQATELIQ